MKKLIVLLVLLLTALPSYAFTGKVVAVADGDTVTVLNPQNQQVKIRLYGVDCPERSQDYGTKAKQFTSESVFEKVVEVDPVVKDRYGRTVGIVHYEGKNLSEELVRAGYAWVYTRYCDRAACSDWADLQKKAQALSKGLWADSDPTPPWEYRRGGKVSSSKSYAAKDGAAEYHGNRKSKKFHRPDCRYFNCKNCTAVFSSQGEAINAGYSPCGICRP